MSRSRRTRRGARSGGGRPGRTARRTGSKPRGRRRPGPPRLAVASAFAMVLVLLGSAWWGWREARDPIAPEDDPFAKQTELPPEPHPIARIEVLNGAGEAGAAQKAAEILRQAGFDVVYFGNAGDFDNPRTRVIDRVGGSGGVDSLVAWLRVEGLETEPDPALHLDATVVLGADWQHRLRLVPDSLREAAAPRR